MAFWLAKLFSDENLQLAYSNLTILAWCHKMACDMILASVVSLKKFKLIYESTFAILFVTLHTQRVLRVENRTLQNSNYPVSFWGGKIDSTHCNSKSTTIIAEQLLAEMKILLITFCQPSRLRKVSKCSCYSSDQN